MAQMLDELNTQRRGMQQQMQGEALAQVNELIAGLGEELPLGLTLFDPGWHQGIVGLVASRVKDVTHRPVIAFAPESEGAAMLKGSARSISGLHIRDVLAHVDARHPGMIKAFGGHAMAAGLSLDAAQLEPFRAALLASITIFLDGAAPRAEIRTDGELPADDLTLEFAQQLQALGPWGQRFDEPLFEGVFEVLEHRVVGGSHLKMTVRPQQGRQSIDAIAFGASPDDLHGPSARLLYRLDVNHFRERETCQLVVERIL
jgi:single-stranded-DNA-specific exonuclease